MAACHPRRRSRAACAAAAAAAAAAALSAAGAFVPSALAPRAAPPAAHPTGPAAAAAPAAPGGAAAPLAAVGCAAAAAVGCAAARRGAPPRARGAARRAGEKPAEEKKEEEPNMMDKIKRFGPAGIASYAITEGGFWLISIPGVCLFYAYATGEWPDLTSQEDQAKVAGASFAFLNVARLVVPVRVGVALALAPWVDENVIKPFFPDQWKAWQEECSKKDECPVSEEDLSARSKA